MESHGVRMCGVCDEKIKPRTPSIACISCQNHVHLKKCAAFSFREAKKLNGKFNCSKCSVSEIQTAINDENLKLRINKRGYFVAWFCCGRLCDAYILRSERLVNSLFAFSQNWFQYSLESKIKGMEIIIQDDKKRSISYIWKLF